MVFRHGFQKQIFLSTMFKNLSLIDYWIKEIKSKSLCLDRLEDSVEKVLTSVISCTIHLQVFIITFVHLILISQYFMI